MQGNFEKKQSNNALASISLLLVSAIMLGISAAIVHPAVFAVLAGSSFIFYLFLRAPKLALVLLLLFRVGFDGFIRQYRLFGDTAASINLLGLTNIAALLVSFFYFAIVRKKLPRYPFVTIYLVFLGIALTSGIKAEDPLLSIRGWTIVGSSLAIYTLTVSNFKDENSLGLLRTILSLSSVIPLSVGIYQIVAQSGNTMISPGLNRIMGTLFHPSFFGMYLVILWPLLLYQTWYSRKIGVRIFYLALLATATLSIIMTYTRIAWLALLWSIFGVLLIFRRFKLLLAFGIISTIIALYYSEPLIARFAEAFSFVEGRVVFAEYGSLAWRIDQWRIAIRLFLEHPVLGVGWWNFPLYNPTHSPPHNDYLRVMTELGIPGIICYLALIGYLMFWFTQAYLHLPKRSSEANFIGLVLISIGSFVILCITDNPLGLPEVSWYLWALIAIGVNTARYAIRERNYLSLQPQSQTP
jgi:putative inorganic carbon (HCO3(-)) transporter